MSRGNRAQHDREWEGLDIVLAIHGFSTGGAERVAARLVDELRRSGQRVGLITLYRPDEDIHGIAPDVPRVALSSATRSVNRIQGALRNVRTILMMRRAMRRSGATTVVSFLTNMNVRSIIASRGLGLRVVVSERNDTSRQRADRGWDLLRRLTYRQADAVTANSLVSLRDMRSYVPGRKLMYVPNPVDLPASTSSPSTSTKVLNVGRLAPHKGQRVAITAFANLGHVGAGWSLVMLGDGPERAGLEGLARQEGIGDRIELPGFVSDPTPYYMGAAMFILPSEYEGTPGALLEAMAYGLPCVVADCLPGALEYIEDGINGLSFRSGDREDLAGKLRTLIENPSDRDRLGGAARSTVERLDPDRVMTAWRAALTGR